MKKIKTFISFVILLITCQMFTYCSSGNLLSQVIGKEWKVTSIEGRVLDESKLESGLPNLTFLENGNLTGFTGCNTFNGSYKFEGDKIFMDPGSMTKMMCLDAPEVEFLSALKKVSGIMLERKNLIFIADGISIMDLTLSKESK